MANCFDNVPFENIEICPNEEIAGGITTRLYYAPCDYFERFDLPTSTTDFESRVVLPQSAIAFKAGKGWKHISIQRDLNEIKTSLLGNVSNKKSKVETDFTIPGFRPKVLGFIDTYKNTPCVYAFEDLNGQVIIVGTKKIGAYIESAETTTGKKLEDDSGANVKISASVKALFYKGEISSEATTLTSAPASSVRAQV